MKLKNKHTRPSKAEIGIELEKVLGPAVLHDIPDKERKVVEEQIGREFWG